MDWLNIKNVLSPEVIRNIMDSKEIFMVKYYTKPREITCYTTIFFEFLNKQKEIAPYILEICERKSYYSEEHVIVINHKTVRYKDSYILTSNEYNKFKTVFELLGFKVVR